MYNAVAIKTEAPFCLVTSKSYRALTIGYDSDSLRTVRFGDLTRATLLKFLSYSDCSSYRGLDCCLRL